MTANVIAINPSLSLLEAQNLFRKHKIRHLPVVKDEKLIGILSLTDLQRVSFASISGDGELSSDSALIEMLNVEHIMRKEPTSVSDNQTIADVAEILAEEEFHALPVTQSGTNKLVGIVTTTDLIRYMLKKEYA
ncbi:MAG: CBS domain-containing protein [Flammeovirgaceae bacterium]